MVSRIRASDRTRDESVRTSIVVFAVLVGLMVLGSVSDAVVWGSKGHRIIGLLARELLSPETTPEGGRIEVSAMPRRGFVPVSVSDTGNGIHLVPKVCGAPRRADLGEERARSGLDVHVHDHDSGALRRVSPSKEALPFVKEV